MPLLTTKPKDIVDDPTFAKFLQEECAKRHPCTILLEICHKLNLTDPTYEFLNNLNSQNDFECRCKLVDLKCFGIGVGKNKKLAKADAAQRTIEMIAHIPDVQSIIMSLMMASSLQQGVLRSSP
jgi:dsRNA-specific ribonuclease